MFAVDVKPEVWIAVLVNLVLEEVGPLASEIGRDYHQTAISPLTVVIQQFAADKRLPESDRVGDDTAVILCEFLRALS